MKRILNYSILCVLLLFTNSIYSQSEKILSPSKIYQETIKSTVIITTNTGNQGMGFYVAPNVIATNYHLVKGSSEVSCKILGTDNHIFVSGYLAVDKDIDLILLKVNGAPQTPLQFAIGNVAMRQIVYTVNITTILEGTIYEIKKTDKLTSLQLTTPISYKNGGSPVVNRVGTVVGIATYTDGSSFVINHTHLQGLMQQMRTIPLKLTALNNPSNTNPKSVKLYNKSNSNRWANYNTSPSSVKYYTNSFGEKVQSPTYYSQPPIGATALCRDGTYSFSRNRRGTCSHHGGVAKWL